MSENAKVKPGLQRIAVVYVRQSSASQVENNRESTARQYATISLSPASTEVERGAWGFERSGRPVVGHRFEACRTRTIFVSHCMPR